MAAKTLLWFSPLANEPPATNGATIGWRNGHPYLRFAPAPASAQAAVWTATMPTSYNGGGLIVRAFWTSPATTGHGVLDAALERIATAGLDIDADSWATAVAASAVTVDATSGKAALSSITITGASLASIVAGDLFRLRLRRDLADTAAGNAEVLGVEFREA
jgi:hypothetical protein